MSDVGTTHEDLERFLAEHHLVGAGLRRDGRAAPRQGNTAAHWKWDGIYRGLMRSGEIVTVGPERHDRHALGRRHRSAQVSDLDERADSHARRAHPGASQFAQRNAAGLPSAEGCCFRLRVRSLPDGARRRGDQPGMDISRSLEQRHHAGDLDRRLRQRLQPQCKHQRAHAQRRAV